MSADRQPPDHDLAALLDRVTAFIRRYVVVTDEQATAIALWVAHTWAFKEAHATPYLLVVSPEKECGKSRLFEVLALLVRRPWKPVAPSESVLFRKIERDRPTLLFEELDAVFGSATERTEPLRGLLNAGNRPGTTAARCMPPKWEPRDFEIYCAKALAGIDKGRIPDTIIDRSIVIRMRRRAPTEPIKKFRVRPAEEAAKPVAFALHEWARASAGTLLDAEPEMPPGLKDRAEDSWEPLLAIADRAGGDWPARARNAARLLSGDGGRDDESEGIQLLGAIRAAIGDRPAIATADLLAKINEDEKLPFGDERNGAGLNAHGLAHRLKRYEIRPRNIRIGATTPKGYRRDQFEDAFARYVADPVTPVWRENGEDDPQDLAPQRECGGVADNPPFGERERSGNGRVEILATDEQEALAERAAHVLDEAEGR